MLVENLSNTLLRYLRVPPGAHLRHPNEVTTSPLGSQGSTEAATNEYIDAMISITVDDVCIGEEPLSIDCEETTPEIPRLKLDEIKDEFNTIVKDVAADLLEVGVSVWIARISNLNKLVLLPLIPDPEDEYHFYLTYDKKVVCIKRRDNKDIVVKDCILFFNYSKKSLLNIPKESKEVDIDLYAFEVLPEPMQLKNASSTINSLSKAESNLDRYRASTSRIARWANVDIGISQGDHQQDVVDTISSTINANSAGLGSNATEFDDNIPVLANRKGIGRVELQSDVPNYNLDKIGDIQYYLSKLGLLSRFPSSYLDYSQNIDAAAASLIRGDVRYAKLINKVRSKIVATINDFLRSSENFRQYNPTVTLTQLPSSEDDDVISALGQYIEIATDTENFVFAEGSTKAQMVHRLNMLQSLFASSCTSPMLQSWFDEMSGYIEKAEDIQEAEGADIISEAPEGGSFEDAVPDIETEPTDLTEQVEPPSGSDVEIIEPGTV